VGIAGSFLAGQKGQDYRKALMQTGQEFLQEGGNFWKSAAVTVGLTLRQLPFIARAGQDKGLYTSRFERSYDPKTRQYGDRFQVGEHHRTGVVGFGFRGGFYDADYLAQMYQGSPTPPLSQEQQSAKDAQLAANLQAHEVQAAQQAQQRTTLTLK